MREAGMWHTYHLSWSRFLHHLIEYKTLAYCCVLSASIMGWFVIALAADADQGSVHLYKVES